MADQEGLWLLCSFYQAIPRESPSTILTNKWVAGSNGETDELVNVLCPSGAYEKVFWWFLDLSQFASNWPRMLDKKTNI